MRSYPLHEARSKLSTLIERALKGETQRITRHGKDAVILVAEEAWNERPKSDATLADLFLKTAGKDKRGFSDAIGRKPWAKDKGRFGADFT
jgi:prevent-host-death family protein